MPSRIDDLLDRRHGRVAGRLHTVDDARRLARRRVPRPVFDYIDGAAGSESTLEANRTALEAVEFLPRMGVSRGFPGPDLATTVLGQPVSMPLLLSPVGFTRMMHPSGDVAGARAAGAAGTVFTLSSMSGHTMEEVSAAAAEGGVPPWFQLYSLGGRQGAEQLVDRAGRAGFRVLVVTLDTQVPGNRERDLRYGLSPPLQLDRRTVTAMAPLAAVRPWWLVEAARDRFRLELVNAASLGMSATDALVRWLGAPPTWEDFGWIREHWTGPVVAKGVLTAEDARRALDSGADAVCVSNHGGRQLDGVPATIRALVEVVDAVGDRSEVLVDGGFRRGADVVKALAVGARAAMIGRPWSFGLAAAAQPGVEKVLAVLRADIDRTLRLLGVGSVADLDRSHVRLPAPW